MELIKISRSKSFEMINGFGLKHWDKLSAEMSINLGEDPKEGYKAMEDLINEVHKDSYSEWGELPVIQVGERTKPMMDMIVLKQYNKAILDKDTKTIEQIKAHYHVEY